MKKKHIIQLTESQYKKLFETIKETAYNENEIIHRWENYIDENNIVEYHNFIPSLSIFDNSKDINQIIDEGLIHTYPVDKVKTKIVTDCWLNPEDVIPQVRTSINGDKITLIFVVIDKYDSSEKKGDIITQMNRYGYFLARDFQPHRQFPNRLLGMFEPKFTNKINDELRQSCRYLYHTAPFILLNKIQTIGLTPRTKNSQYKYPPRVFFMRGDKMDSEQIRHLGNVQKARNNSARDTNNPKENYQHCLIKLDLSKIPNNVNFYNDPNSHGGIFTYDNISPTAIVDIIPFTLSNTIS